MSSEFWIGLLIQLVVYGVSIGAIYGTIKTRLNYIEAKLDKHNNVVERVYKLEKDQAVLDEKQVVLRTGSIFVCTCIVALIFSWNEKPTEVFTYIIPTAGGVFGAAVIWYLKAVQLENGIKIQLGMIKKLIDMGEENPAEEIKERTIQKMKDKTEALIDEALEPTEIQNF